MFLNIADSNLRKEDGQKFDCENCKARCTCGAKVKQDSDGWCICSKGCKYSVPRIVISPVDMGRTEFWEDRIGVERLEELEKEGVFALCNIVL